MELQALLAQLTHQDIGLRQQAAQWCAKKPVSTDDHNIKTTIRDALIRLLNDEDAQIRRQAVLALGHFHDDTSIVAIAHQLHDPTPAVRRRVCAFLIKYPHFPALATPLITLLQDDKLDYAGRDFAAMTLASGNHREAIPAIIAILESDHRAIYRRMAHCLIRMPHPDALSALQRIANDDTIDTITRKVARRAIQHIEAAEGSSTSTIED